MCILSKDKHISQETAALDWREEAGGCGGGDCPGGRAAGDPGGGVSSQHQQGLGGPGGLQY